jgi:hypothetical protein
MSDRPAQNHRYRVTVYQPEDAGGPLVFTFSSHDQGNGGVPKRAPQFTVAVRQEASGLAFDWNATPDDPGGARAELEAEVAARMRDRAAWLGRVNSLIDEVERWGKELGWSTRRVEKKLEDTRVGTHRVPALLLQEDTCRVLLEPVGRSAPGAEGVVDLYLMPAYDDIAGLYYYDHQWHLHYLFHGARPGATLRDAKGMPLSKESLHKVLVEMRQHAA